jgi:hypothetical protein
MVATDEMKVLSGGKKAEVADIGHLVGPMGVTQDYSGKLMLPAAGNPNGFPLGYSDWGVLFQFHGSANPTPQQIGIDTSVSPSRLYFRSAVNGGINQKVRDPAAVQYDHWYSWRIQVKWSLGSDGFINFWLDDQRLAAWTGPTVHAGEGVPYLQFGFYSGAQFRNEVIHAALRKG